MPGITDPRWQMEVVNDSLKTPRAAGYSTRIA